MNIYGYIRLNSHRPVPKNLRLNEQARVIRKWSADQGLIITRIFRDNEFSSASLELPNLKKLISLIEQGKVGVVVVARLDRFTRTIRLYQKLLKLFSEHNVRFISIAEGVPVRITSPGSRVMFVEMKLTNSEQVKII